MKRILAMVLCWTMLLSQMVMVADAARMKEQSDLLYMGENGIIANEGGEVIIDGVPLGRSDTGEKYAPAVPKFVPEALRNLGIEARTEESIVEEEADPDDAGPAPVATTYTATIKSDKVMMYAFPRSDAESVYLYNCGGLEVELYSTDSVLWYRYNEVNDVNNGAFRGYSYIYADDVILHDRVPTRGIVAKDKEGFAVEIKGAPAIAEAAVRKVDASRAPTRTWVKDGGVRTLIGSYDISVRNPDRSAWQPLAEPVEVFLTLPEVPEMGRWGRFVVEYLDAEGNLQAIVPNKCFLSNVIVFKTDYLTEVFVYTLDYPEDTDIIFLEPNIPVEFSYLYGFYDMSDVPFEDIKNVTYSDPEKVKIEWFYDEEAKRGDWLVTMLEIPAQAERFIVDFADHVPKTRANIYSSNGDFSNTLYSTNHYWVDASIAHDGNLNVNSGTVTITFGEYGGTGKTLTIDGCLHIEAGERVNFTINNNTSTYNCVFRRATAHNDQIVYVRGSEAKFVVYGADGAKEKMCLDGYDNHWAVDPLLIIGDGGTAYLENCYVRNADNSSTHNNSTDDQKYKGYPGGGIYCGGTLRLGDDVQIYNNRARQGGGIYMADGTTCSAWDGQNGDATDNKTDIKNNTADAGVGNGGGLYLAGTAIYKAYVGVFSGNSATGSEGKGGGVCIGSSGSFNPANACSIKDNSAKYGGGIYQGGGMFAPSKDVAFSGNSASTDGGGFYMSGGTFKPAAKVTFSSNKANSGHGGGLYVNSGTVTINTDSHFGTDGAGNTAKWGAGVYVKNGTFNGSALLWIRYNQATNNGGGLMVEGGTLTVSGKQAINIGYNKALDGYGGGLNVYNSSAHFNDNSSGGISIYGNTASGETADGKGCGGGIYLNSGTITTNGDITVGTTDDGTTEKGNKAGWGGGICIWSGTFTCNGSVTVQYNDKATISKGGGVYMYGGTLAGSGTMTIKNNIANYGGGMYLGGSTDTTNDTSGKSVTISCNIVVNNNTGNNNGGGIMTENCTIAMSGGANIHTNTSKVGGGGIYASTWVGPVKWTVTSPANTFKVENNVAATSGGGIYANCGTAGYMTFANKIWVGGNKANGGNGGGFNVTSGSVTIGEATMHKNTASNYGGCIYNGATFNINGGCVIGSYHTESENTGNSAKYGGAIYQAAGTFTFNAGVSMGHNKATEHGGGMYIAGGTMHLKSGTHTIGAWTYTYPEPDVPVAGNEAKHGGGICVVGTATFKSEGTLIVNGNKATSGNGGGILAENATGGISITGSNNTINNNTANQQGGAIRCLNTNATIQNTTMDSNTATNSHAGGIISYRTDGADGYLNLKNCNITKNKCLNGDGGTSDTDRGAGIYAQSLSLTIEGGSVSENTTPFGIGGGIYFNSSGKALSVKNCTINKNNASGSSTDTMEAGRGGGLFIIAGSSATIEGSTINGNTVTDNGGGIYTRIALTIDTTTIGASGAGNIAAGNGGGIATIANVTVTGGSIGYNEAGASKAGTVSTDGGNGGGIWLETSGKTITLSGVEMRNNVAHRTGESTGHGGAVYVKSGALKLKGAVKLHDNEAKGNGGGIYMDTVTFTSEVANSATPQIYSNKALYGGGIFVTGTAAQSWSNLVVGNATDSTKGNEATTNGGGIYVDKISLTLASTVGVHGNSAGNNGGGIFIIQDGASTVPTLELSASTTLSNNSATKAGGGIYASTANVTLNSGVNVSGNTAGTLGGGVYMLDKTLALKTATVQNNTATNGGGIYLYSGTVSVSGTNNNVTGNSASGDGGGIYLNGGTCTNSGTLNVTNNTAAANGGGIYTKINLTLGSTSSVTHNTAGKKTDDGTLNGGNGGGIYIYSGNVTVNSSNATTISSNEAYSKAQNGTGGFGGGVYVNSGATLTLAAGTLSSNKAVSPATSYSQTALGGGIYTNGTVNVTGNFTISGNTTTRYGGGIYQVGGTITISDGKTLTVNGTNRAGQFGGGIVVNGGTLTSNGTGALTVSGNTATSGGGGICMDNGGTISVKGTVTINSNKAGVNVDGTNASSGSGGGLYMSGAKASFAPTGAVNIHSNTAVSNGGGLCTSVNGFAPTGTTQFYSNTASGLGGGIYTTGTWTMGNNVKVGCTVSGSNLGNTAKDGGGIYVNGGALTVKGVQVVYNQATQNGGGIYVNSGTLTFNTSNPGVNYNKATGNGGGMYLNAGTTNVDGVRLWVQGNGAVNGGGIYVTGANTVLKTSNAGAFTIARSNAASNYGGGIYQANGEISFTGTGGSYLGGFGDPAKDATKYGAGNTAKRGAGAYFAGGKCTISCTLRAAANVASDRGGAFYVAGGNFTYSGADLIVGTYVYTETTIGNKANYGGGIFVESGSATLSKANFNGNFATQGGGAYVGGGKLELNTGSTIQNHIYRTDGTTKIQYGAGVYMSAGEFVLDSSSITNNETGSNACGLCMNGTEQKATLKNGASVTNNIANGTAGGIWMNGKSTLNLDGTVTISGNKANNGVGGGIYFAGSTEGHVNVNGTTTVSGNTASTDGGGIYITNSHANSKVTVASGATLNVSSNTASRNGGGIYFYDGTVAVTGALNVNNNTATVNGGGMHMGNTGTLSGEGAVNVYSNKAVDGAGMYLTGASFSLSATGNVKIYSNTASDEGGGIYSARDWSMGGNIKVGCTVNSSNLGNTAKNGGGIYVASGTITTSGTVQVLYNTATEKGGGIYLASDGITNASGTLNVNNNKTNSGGHGGGIYMAGGTFTNNGTMTSSSNVSGAATSGKGGGLYLAGGTFKTTSHLTIGSNQAYQGAGVFLAGGIFETAGTSTGDKYYITNNKGVGTTAASHGAGFFAQNGTIRINSAASLCVYRNYANYGPGMFFGQNGGTITIDGEGAGELWPHENHDTSGDGSGIWIESCTVELKHKTKVNRQVYGAADEPGKNGNTKGAIRIQKLNSRSDKGILNIYATLLIQSCEGGDWSGGITMNAYGELNVKSGGTLEITGCKSNTGNGGAIQNNGGVITNAGTMTIGADGKANTAVNGGGIYVGYDSTTKTGSITNTGTMNVAYNTATTNGGGVYLDASTSLSSSATLNVNNNGATSNGGGVYMTSATLSMTGTTSIYSNTATADGGGIYYDSGTITVGGTPSIYTNTAKNGGGIYANSALTLNGAVTIGGDAAAKGNTASVNGGGIYAANTLSLTSVTVKFNTGADGGGVYATGATTLSSVTLNNNTATSEGGGLYLTAAASLTSTTVAYDYNKAASGGGIYSAGATMTFTNSHSIDGNTASNKGGGIYMLSGTLNLDTGTYQLNVQSNKACYGGGLYLGGGDATLKTININGTGNGGLDVNRNEANQGSSGKNGGGIMMERCTVNLNQPLYLIHNTASNVGGGIYVNKWNVETTLNINKNVYIRGNTAGSNGGGMNVNVSTVVIASGITVAVDNAAHSNPTLEAQANSAANGGGIYLSGSTLTNKGTLNVNNNTATTDGGGIYLNSGTFDNQGTLNVTNNTAVANGGGIYTKIGLTLGNNSTVTGNKAGANADGTVSTTGGNGGGIYVASSSLTMNAATINYNTAYAVTSDTTTGNGGGIYMATGSLSVTGTSSHIDNNTAQNNGGGLYMSAGTITLAMTSDGSAENDLQVHHNNAKNGAGVYFGDSGKITITTTDGYEGRFHAYNNTASANGGGMHISGCEVDAASELKLGGNNEATNGNGGGLYIGNAAKLTLSNSRAYIYMNKAVNGAGIYVDIGTTFTPTKGFVLHDNAASGNGGGLYTKIAMTLGNNVLIGHTTGANVNVPKPNKAVHGAGIYVDGVILTLSGVSIKYNQASQNGGGIYMNGGELKTSGNSIGNVTENYAGVTAVTNGVGTPSGTGGNGGGIYFTNSAKMTMSGGTLSGNYAYNADGQKNGNGGGIAIDNGTVTVSGSSTLITENVSVTSGGGTGGGGVYIKAGSFTLQSGAKIQKNTSNTDGGGIFIAGGTATVTGTGTAIDCNYAKYGGGAYMTGGQLNLADKAVISNHSLQKDGTTLTADGGGVWMSNGTLSMTGASKIQGNQVSGYGGGIKMNNGTVILDGSSAITTNTAGNGGGICMLKHHADLTSSVTVKGSSAIEYNTASTDGGGVWTSGGTLSLSGGKVQYNRAAQNGGGIHISGSASVTDGNMGTVQYNYAGVPAGVDVSQIETTGFDYTTITGGNGGGIYIASGATVTMNSGTLQNNYAYAEAKTGGAGNGGGIYIVSGGTLNLNGGTIQNNRAYVPSSYSSTALGGGVYNQGALNVLSGTVNITTNYASRYGGGICQGGANSATTISKGATLNVNSNTSNIHGGGYAIGNGTVTVDGTLNVQNNTATTGNGGGFCMDGSGHVTGEGKTVISGNSAVNGGGIYIITYSSATGNDRFEPTGVVEITGNTASKNGGGVFITDGNGTRLVKLQNKASKIDGNYAQYGGGAYLLGGSLILTGATVEGNYAIDGGGAYVKDGTLTVNGGTVIQNHTLRADGKTAMRNGGGIHMTGGTVTVDGGSVIQNNSVLRPANTSFDGHGGGIYAVGGTLTVQGGAKIINNTGSYGGGMRVDNATVTVTNAFVSENTALGSGGGFFVKGTGSLTIGGTSEVKGNRAEGSHGGGIYYESGALELKGTATIADNTALTHGGGIYAKANLTIGSGVKISGNYAGVVKTVTRGTTIASSTTGGNGGAIYFDGSDQTLELNGVTIENNSAYVGSSNNETGHGGGIYMKAGTLTATGTNTIHNNTAKNSGGGIYVYSGSFSSNGTLKVTSNKADGAGGGNNGNGGGIYVEVATTFSITGSGNIISGNTALRHGGGVSVYDCNVTIENCTIDSNTATNGHAGGVFFKDNHNGNRTLTLKNCDITKNQCLNSNNGTSEADRGAGVFVELAHLIVSGGSIRENKAVYGKGGGIYFSAAGKTLSVSNCTISNNEVLNTNETTAGTAGHGGGICVNSAQSVSISGVSFTGNKAAANGGGIYCNTVDLSLDSTNTFDGNMAGTIKNSDGTVVASSTGGNGGGIFFTGSGKTLTLDGVELKNNVARNAPSQNNARGGGVAVEFGNLTVKGAMKIHNNHADYTGGGISVKGSTSVTPAVSISGGDIYDNTAPYGAGVYATSATVSISGGKIYSNDASNAGGGLYVNKSATTITGGEITGNTATKYGGGIIVSVESSLTMTGLQKSPIWGNIAGIKTGAGANWDSAAGNDIHASGADKGTTVIISATTDNGVPEYWFADYAKNATDYPGQPTFRSAYGNLGRYNPDTTPITYARRYFGAAYESQEAGATVASTAPLALTLGTTVKYMNLTLTKVLEQDETAVENTTFIFYIKGVDNAEFLMPVAINLEKGDRNGTVTINNLPLGIYDVCEDESWSWRYEPSAMSATGASTATPNLVTNGDDSIRITATADTTTAVTFTNGIENVFWLSDADYNQPFLAPTRAAMKKSYAEDDEDGEETSE